MGFVFTGQLAGSTQGLGVVMVVTRGGAYLLNSRSTVQDVGLVLFDDELGARFVRFNSMAEVDGGGKVLVFTEDLMAAAQTGTREVVATRQSRRGRR